MNIDFVVQGAEAHKKELHDFYVDRPEGTPYYLFIHFSYKTKLCIGDTDYTTEPKACVIFKPGTHQYFAPCGDYFVNSYFYFTGENVEGCLQELGVPTDTVLYPDDADFVVEYLRSIEREFFRRDLFCEQYLDNLVKNFFIELNRACVGTREGIDLREEKTIEDFNKLRAHFLSLADRHCSVKTMASYVGLSRSRFTVLYNKYFHTSPHDDLINARIERAKFYLTHKTFTVKEISIMLGYENVSHFSRQFKTKVGKTPNQYRKNTQNIEH